MAARAATVALMIQVLLLLLVAPPTNSELRGFRATMVRREKTINFTRAARQSSDRLSMLAARLDADAGTQTPLRYDNVGEYNMEFSIGTPPQKLTAVADTGSDLVWAKCGPCASCKPQGSPSFDPTKSSSFSKMPCSDRLCTALASQASCSSGGSECDYQYGYGSGSADGYMGTETLFLGSDSVPGVGFGCTNKSSGNLGTGSGLVGLGHGPLSLVSQLGVGAFSYCLNPDASMASPLLFGSLATLSGDGVQSTGLLGSSTLYSVRLKSITVGSRTTPGAGKNGIIFDSGTTMTMLADPAYTTARTAILAQTMLPLADDGSGPCFRASGANDISKVPPMVLHFDGADMNLTVANYFVKAANGVICWVVQPSSTSLSIIGNIMQTNYHIRYDLDKKVLSFQPANCNSM